MNQITLLSALLIASEGSSAQAGVGAESPVAWWSFDPLRGTGVVEQVSGLMTAVIGAAESAPGVRGASLQLDGFTSRLVHAAEDLPRFGPALTGHK